MLKDQLVGTWSLVAMEGRPQDGPVFYPYGEQPKGLLSYSADGWVTAQIFRADRPRVASGDTMGVAPDEASALANGSVSYFGRYEIDEGAWMVTHHVVGALFPNWEGRALRRSIAFSGDHLIITTPLMPTGGHDSVHVLTWARATSEPLGESKTPAV